MFPICMRDENIFIQWKWFYRSYVKWATMIRWILNFPRCCSYLGNECFFVKRNAKWFSLGGTLGLSGLVLSGGIKDYTCSHADDRPIDCLGESINTILDQETETSMWVTCWTIGCKSLKSMILLISLDLNILMVLSIPWKRSEDSLSMTDWIDSRRKCCASDRDIQVRWPKIEWWCVVDYPFNATKQVILKAEPTQIIPATCSWRDEYATGYGRDCCENRQLAKLILDRARWRTIVGYPWASIGLDDRWIDLCKWRSAHHWWRTDRPKVRDLQEWLWSDRDFHCAKWECLHGLDAESRENTRYWWKEWTAKVIASRFYEALR